MDNEVVPLEYDDIAGDLDLYEKGRTLRTVYETDAWKIIMGVFEDYRDKAARDLIALAPGDPYVPTAHAAASALEETVAKAQQDFAEAVEAARNPNPEVLSYLMTVKDNLPSPVSK